MKRITMTAAAAGLFVGGALSLAPAFADYMSECDELIAAWDACRAAGQSRCTAEEERIIEECRCHERQGDEWLFVHGSLSSGVCNADEPIIITPPPPPPPPTEIIEPPRNGRGGGDDEERGGGDDDEDDHSEQRQGPGGSSTGTISSAAEARPSSGE